MIFAGPRAEAVSPLQGRKLSEPKVSMCLPLRCSSSSASSCAEAHRVRDHGPGRQPGKLVGHQDRKDTKTTTLQNQYLFNEVQYSRIKFQLLKSLHSQGSFLQKPSLAVASTFDRPAAGPVVVNVHLVYTQSDHMLPPDIKTASTKTLKSLNLALFKQPQD